MKEKTVKQIVPQIKLSYRNNVLPEKRLKITGTEKAYEILLSCWDRNRIELVEEVKMMVLDRRHHCLGVYALSTGGVSECIIDLKIVFSTALLARSSTIILTHNHPSGNLEPSFADKLITNKVAEGARMLDMTLMDHMIVTPHHYYSFAENGLLESYCP